MVHVIFTCGITHPGLRVNADQTQVLVQDNHSSIFDEKGKKQVFVTGKMEKCAWTCGVGVLDSCKLLPFQIIVQGATKNVHPLSTAPRTSRARQMGIEWNHTRKMYWSDQTTMHHYVTQFIVPYFECKKRKLGYSPKQVCIFYINTWSVHWSLEFWRWVCKTYPWLWLIHVPANLTGLIQPCDVGIQCPFKLSICGPQLQDMVDTTVHHLNTGGSAVDFKLDTRIRPLCNQSVGWFIDAYDAINNINLVKRAWDQSRAGKLNSSFKSLTSPVMNNMCRAHVGGQVHNTCQVNTWQT
jgi:hypothetical protein